MLKGILIIAMFEVIENNCALNYGTNRTSKLCSISINLFGYSRVYK